MVPLARAYFLAVLNGIATKRHSRAVAVTIISLVFSKTLLDYLDYFRFGKKFVWATLYISVGELNGALHGLLFG